MQIDLGRFEVSVSEKFLDVADVRSVCEKVRSTAMAEAVNIYFDAFDFGFLSVFADILVNRRIRQTLSGVGKPKGLGRRWHRFAALFGFFGVGFSD